MRYDLRVYVNNSVLYFRFLSNVLRQKEATHSKPVDVKLYCWRRQPRMGCLIFYMGCLSVNIIEELYMQELRHTTSKHHQKKDSRLMLIILIGIFTLFLLLVGFSIASVRNNIKTINCQSFWTPAGTCQSGYATQQEQVIEFNPISLPDILLLSIITTGFLITVFLAAKNDGRLKKISVAVWSLSAFVGIIVLSIIWTSLAGKPELLPGGITRVEADCNNKIMISLEQGSPTPQCTSSTLNSLSH